MGRRRGQTRCSWCYTFGHNRATCEELTKSYKHDAVNEAKVSKKMKPEDMCHSDHYYQKRYAKRIKATKLLDGTPYEAYRPYRQSSTRTCSFCGNSGHNRRKCELFEVQKESLLRNTKVYRKALKKQLTNSGWGIGALVQHRDDVFMITSVDWSVPSVLSFCRNNDCVTLTHINTTLPSWQRTRSMALPPLERGNIPKSLKKELPWCENALERAKGEFDEQQWTSYKLVSGVEGFVFPKGWDTTLVNEKEVSRLEKHFKEMEHTDKWETQHKAKYNND